MSDYDGSWKNDPLDLRCIRLDAEMEAKHGPKNPEDMEWKPASLQELYVIRAENPSLFKALHGWATQQPSRFGKKLCPCYVLDQENNIIPSIDKCSDPVTARHEILELSIRENKMMSDYKILRIEDLKLLSFKEVNQYE